MKVLKYVSIALLSGVLTVSTAFGNNGPKAGTIDLSVREQIGASLSDVSEDTKGEVYIYFSASSKEGFKLLNVTGQDNSLVSTVRNVLDKSRIAIPEGMSGSYSLKIRFADNRYSVNNVSYEFSK